MATGNSRSAGPGSRNSPFASPAFPVRASPIHREKFPSLSSLTDSRRTVFPHAGDQQRPHELISLG